MLNTTRYTINALGDVISTQTPQPSSSVPVPPHAPAPDEPKTPALLQYEEDQRRLYSMDCGFLQNVSFSYDEASGRTEYGCEFLSPKRLLYGLVLAPVAVPLLVADGIVSGRPAKRWLNPIPGDEQKLMKSLGLYNMGFGGIPVMIGAGLLSLYLWYRIYKHVKGGN